MKTKLLSIKNSRALSKNEQKKINGGFWGGNSCTLTGCHSHYLGSPYDGIVGLEGGPCAIATPIGEACIGILKNGQCCIG